MKKIIALLLILSFSLTPAFGAGIFRKKDRNSFIVFCYHDIPKDVYLDNYGTDRAAFVQQLEYLRTHGYSFVSLQDIVEANQKKKKLPPKAVLLTFDDAYISFYEFVYPLLKLYGYPCVLAVTVNWIENPASGINVPLMNWKQLKEVAQSGLVEIAGHSYNLHREVIYNPQGNTGWAGASRIYDPETNTYEGEERFRQRIHNDLFLSKAMLDKKLNINVRVVAWPYGKCNKINIEEARKLGMRVTFTLEEPPADVTDLTLIPRHLVFKNPKIEDFIKEVNTYFKDNIQGRILQADLDLIYDPDAGQQERNLDEFIERVAGMRVSTVYLQAFCDDKGDGNIASVYFPSRVLPTKADLFSRVANQLSIRGIKVYAWMPMLSIVLPDAEENESLRVMEFKDGKKGPATSWYARLSPFDPTVREKMAMLYEDMAANAKIDGVVFLDDGYLNDFEDFSPYAAKEYRQIAGRDNIPYSKLSAKQKRLWTRAKTVKLIEFSKALEEAVCKYQPFAIFARTLYAPVVTSPESEEWFAQNYAYSLAAYDYVVIMAYPYMEEVSNPAKWLKQLVKSARRYPFGLEKTVFKVQSYDWEKERWIDSKTVLEWLRTLVSAGALHVGYYPDNYLENQPDAEAVRLIMSTEDFSFERERE